MFLSLNTSDYSLDLLNITTNKVILHQKIFFGYNFHGLESLKGTMIQILVLHGLDISEYISTKKQYEYHYQTLPLRFSHETS